MTTYKVADMSNKKQSFNLSVKELKYIQVSIQTQISQLSRLQTFETADEAYANHKKVQELMHVLETLKSQRTWANNVQNDDDPLESKNES